MAEPLEGPPRRLAVVYEKVPNKPTVTATGAFGGPSPDQHNIIAQLYVEHGTVPSTISHAIREDGSVDLQHGDPISRGDITREIQATLVLSPEAAVLIGNWLVTKGIAAINGRGKIEDKGDE
jgi:hypothetical protein